MKTHNTKPTEPVLKNKGRTKHHLNAERKPRSDSPLRMLPGERQKQIIASLQTRSQKDVIADILKTDNITVCSGTLSRFCQWHNDRSEAFGQKLHDHLEQLVRLTSALDHPTPAADLDKMVSLGIRLICAEALRNIDAPGLIRLKRLQQRDRMTDLDERRFALVREKAEIEAAEREHRLDLEHDSAQAIAHQFPLWAEAEAKKSEPKVTTIEELEASVRKSFGLSTKAPAPQPGKAPAPSAAVQPQPEGSSACRPGAPTGRPQPAPDDPWAPKPQPTAPRSQTPQTGRAAAPSGAAQPKHQPAPSDGARLCSAPVPAEPAAASANAANPTGSFQPKPVPTPHSALPTQHSPAASVPPTDHGPRTTDKTPHSPLPPEPPYWHPPANQAPVNLPEERMCIAELLNVPLPGDSYLRMGHVGLELASKTKAFYPRLLCKVEFLTPEYVREVMADIRRGVL